MPKKSKTTQKKTSSAKTTKKAESPKQEPQVVYRKRRWSMLIPAFSIVLLVLAIAFAIYARYFTFDLNQQYGISSPSLTKEASEDVAVSSLGYAESLGDVATSDEQLIVQTGAYTITVDDADEAIDAIEDIALDLDGTVSSSQLFNDITRCNYAMPLLESASYTTSYPYGCQNYNGYIVVNVPADDFQKAEADIAALDENEEFDEEQTSETNVTEQVADIDARLTTLRAEETALNALLENAESIDDILVIRRELTSTRTEIESLLAQQEDLTEDIELSQLTVYVREITSSVTEDQPSVSARFEIAWEAMKQDLSGIGTGLIYIAVYSLIYIPVLVIVLLAIWLASRFIHRHRK